MKREKTDIVIVGTGVAGLFAALHLSLIHILEDTFLAMVEEDNRKRGAGK